jgi:polyisoprenyl-teichoic acid--peptidoglycan teichoic acid transferase
VAGKEKPYRVYRGGRAKGPIRPTADRAPGGRDGDGAAKPARSGGRRVLRRVLVFFLLGLVFLSLVWALLGYLAVRRGVNEANDRLDESATRALAPPPGSLLSYATNTLVLGADVGAQWKDRQGPARSDSIMLIRTDPDENRIAYLSIPRDLRVEIPGQGADKINAAFSIGGPALTIDTVESLTGLEVNHVVVVDFGAFQEVIDAVGGITIDNPRPVLSNPFDCPLKTVEQCAGFEGWRFRKGEIELDGRRALVYSRIRKNQLDPNESDITRGERQQRVVQGLADEIVSPRSFLRMPFVGDDIVTPLATDLSTGELFQLAWVRWRAADDKTLRCRLGGDAVSSAGDAHIQSSEDNALVIAMITGRSAPQPPRGGPFAPGCFVGRAGA